MVKIGINILIIFLDLYERMNLIYFFIEVKKKSNFRILGLCSGLDVNFFLSDWILFCLKIKIIGNNEEVKKCIYNRIIYISFI